MPPQPQGPSLANPIPGRAVINFPTPVLANGILIEYVSAEQGYYEPIVYGTEFDTVQHGAFPGDYPGYQLVDQRPADTNGYIYRRTWAIKRTLQDTYNYAITYQNEDSNFPTYTTTELVLRSEYTPLAPLTQYPRDTRALLVNEQMLNQTDPPELTSLYVTIARTWEIIPGPIVTTADYDDQLKVNVNTSRQLVLSTDTFDPTSVELLVAMKESPQSEYVKMRVISSLVQLPNTRTEYQTGRYNFPALVTDITLTVALLTTNRSEVWWYPISRAAPTVPAQYKVVTDFFSSEPAPVAIYVLNSQNLIYNGISFNISIANVLNDAITVAAAFTGDTKYGDLSESVTFVASVPTASQYIALIGTYVVTGCDVQVLRGNIWVRRVTSVLLV